MERRGAITERKVLTRRFQDEILVNGLYSFEETGFKADLVRSQHNFAE